MQNIGLILHTVLTNAYTLFCIALGIWSLFAFVRNQTLGGQFWGAIVVNSLLAVALFVLTVLLAIGGISPERSVYYLYGIFFIIVLPGAYTLMKGRDDRTAAAIYAAITIFAALTAGTRAALLTHYPPPI